MCSSAVALSWAWEVVCLLSKDFDQLFPMDLKWEISCYANLPFLNLDLKLLVSAASEVRLQVEVGCRSDPVTFMLLLCNYQEKGLKNWCRDCHRDCCDLEAASEWKGVHWRLGIAQQGGIKPADDEFIQTPYKNVSNICRTQFYKIIRWDSLIHLVLM